jgi:glycosyltransferase involved in cell wall biosynthesis
MFNIIIPLPIYQNYGSAIHALKFADYLVREKTHVRIINLIRLSKLTKSKYALPFDFIFSLIYLSINIKKGDISYFHLSDRKMGIYRDTLYFYVAALKGSKVIIHFHSGHFPEITKIPLFFRILSRMNRIKKIKLIILGDYVSDNLTLYFKRFSKDLEIKKILNDGSHIQIKEPDNETNLQKKWSVLFVSQLYKKKGISVFLDIACRMNELEPSKLNFIIAGRDVENQINASELPPNTLFLGSKTHDQIINLMSKSEILVFPSTYATEAQPLTILEAMSQGLAIIATKYRSIPEMVTAGYNGHLIDPNSHTMADDIIYLLQNYVEHPEELKKHKLNSRKKFDYDFSFNSHEQVFEFCVN